VDERGGERHDGRRTSILVVGVILLVVTATRELAVRTTSTGPLVWTVALDGFPQSIVVDAQTHRAFITTMPLGVGADGTRMSVLDTDTGAILRRLVIGGNGNPPPVVDAQAGRVVVAAAVQVRSGPGVAGIAGHVFVLEGPHTVPVPDSWAWLPVWLRRRLPFLPPPGRHSRVVPGGASMIDPTR